MDNKLEVKIPEEIMKLQENVWLGLTLRQVIATILTLIITTCSFVFIKPWIGEDFAIFIGAVLATPVILIGFVKWHGMTGEKILMLVIIHHFFTPKKITFKSTNIFRTLLNEKLSKIEKGKKPTNV